MYSNPSKKNDQSFLSKQLKVLKYKKKKPLSSFLKKSSRQNPKSEYQTMNNEIICQRRQNILNSKFIVRKNKLKEITKENRKIYDRINSQKSLYSHKDQQKSYEQLRSISSSRATIKQKKSYDNTIRMNSKKNILPKKRFMTLQEENITKMREESLKDFQKIFLFQKSNHRQVRSSFNTSYKGSKKKPEYQMRSLSIKPQQKSKKNDQGILHQIAEELYTKKKLTRKVIY